MSRQGKVATGITQMKGQAPLLFGTPYGVRSTTFHRFVSEKGNRQKSDIGGI